MNITDPIIRKVENIDWEIRLAERTNRMGSSVIRELLKYTQQPGIISFAGGLPAPDFFPVREFKEACIEILDQDAKTALQYSTTEGYRPLKEWLAEAMSRYGIWVEPENILTVNGSQQGLELNGKGGCGVAEKFDPHAGINDDHCTQPVQPLPAFPSPDLPQLFR